MDKRMQREIEVLIYNQERIDKQQAIEHKV